MALSADRNTRAFATCSADGDPVNLLVEDAKVLYAGAMGACNAGEMTPAAATATLRCLGRVKDKVDNTDDGERGECESGAFKWENGDSIDATNLYQVAYAVDDQTVAQSSDEGSRPPAGVIMGVESDGVFVAMSPVLAAVLAASLAGRAISGSGTLVSGTATIACAGLRAGAQILVTRKTPGGTCGIDLAAPSASRTAGTSFVVNAIDAAGATVNTDTSTFDYLVLNP